MSNVKTASLQSITSLRILAKQRLAAKVTQHSVALELCRTTTTTTTMATSSSKVLCRFSCRLQALAHNKLTTKPTLSLELSHLKPKPIPTLPQSSSTGRVSLTSRLPVELGGLESMMPLHSAVASARLVSSLSIESLGWGLVPQGISMPL